MAYETQYMALNVWNDVDDPFIHQMLASNWGILDTHDHDPTTGGGMQIGTGGIALAAITGGQIANNTITAQQIQNLAIGTAQLAELGVTGDKLATGSVGTRALTGVEIPITMLDPTILPLGFIASWWRPPGSSATPGGVWEIMDGRAWNVITNAWGLTVGNIPDMRGSFPQGSDIAGVAGPGIGVAGGSATANLAHSHTVDYHVHGIEAHVHGIEESVGHIHTFANGFYPWLRSNTFTMGITVYDWNGVQRGNTYNSLYLKGYNVTQGPGGGGGGGGYGPDGEFYGDIGVGMDPSGVHNHGGYTDASAYYNTDSSDAGTDTQLGSVSTVPPYVGLLFIMRCR